MKNKIRHFLSEGRSVSNSIDPTFMPISVNHVCMIRSYHAVSVGEKMLFPNREVRDSMKMMRRFFVFAEGYF